MIQNASSPARSKTRWDIKIRGNLMAKLWTITVITGAFAITVANAIGLAIDDTGTNRAVFVFLRLTTPVMIMGVYARLGYRYVDRDKNYPAFRAARMGQLADSLYFLGFLDPLGPYRFVRSSADFDC